MNHELINSFSLVGNIAKINEVKEQTNGNKFRYITVAQNNKYKTKTGEQKDEALFFDIKIFESKFKEFENILSVGNYVHIFGKVQVYKDKDNKSVMNLVGTNARSLKREHKIDQEIFDYDWLNDDQGYEVESGI